MRNLGWRRKLKSLVLVSLGGIGAYSAISFYKNDETFYKNVVMPILHLFDAEKTHKLGVLVNKYRLVPKSTYIDSDSLKVTLFGKTFKNPIGIAAGYDKDCEAVMGLKDLGFGFIEIGSVTPEPQLGNEKPRVFRLFEDMAVINRYGFNSEGHDKVFERLNQIKKLDNLDIIVGVNLGKNKNSSNPINDYVIGINKFGKIADYLVINVSSPNTPGLRTMQHKNILEELLAAVVVARNNLPDGHRPPLLLKLAPDLTYEEKKDIVEVIKKKQCKIDGLIISNTTVERSKLLLSSKSKDEVGGLSGKPLRDAATVMISDMYKLTEGQIPIIGVGGIFTGKDAYDKIKAGASVIQLYTSLVYEGPPVVTKIKKELSKLLAEDGYKSISEAVGRDVK